MDIVKVIKLYNRMLPHIKALAKITDLVDITGLDISSNDKTAPAHTYFLRVHIVAEKTTRKDSKIVKEYARKNIKGINVNAYNWKDPFKALEIALNDKPLKIFGRSDDETLPDLETTRSSPNQKGRSKLFRKERPRGRIQPGMSVGHKNNLAGTIGLVVYKNKEVLLVSCWHVLAFRCARVGNRINQPGFPDGNVEDRTYVANLFLPDKPDKAYPDENGDIAIARVKGKHIKDTSRRQRGTDDGTGEEIIVEKAQKASITKILPLLGEEAQKSGKASGRTFGIIDGVGMYVMRYDELEDPFVFMNGIRVKPRPTFPGDEISRPGDSGALWFYRQRDGESVGLGVHVDGEKSEKTEYAILCHLQHALRKVGLRATDLARKLPSSRIAESEVFLDDGEFDGDF